MQTHEKKPTFYVAKILKRLLDIAWYLAIVMSVGVLVLFAVLGVSQANELFFSAPVEVSQQALLSTENGIAQSGGLQATLKVETTLLMINDASLAFYSLGLLEIVIYLFVLLVTLYLLRGIFADLLKGQPFTYQNARRIWYIGWVFLILSPLKWLRVFLYKDYIQEAAAAAGYELQSWVPFFNKTLEAGQLRLAIDYHLEAAFFGLLLLVLSEVFRQGVQLRTENEAFV